MRREDGAFELDVTVRFRALKLNFLVLVECKHYHPGHKVPRDAVMLLYAKLKTLDAHKGVVFSTSGFQKGAVLFAKKRRIALVDCSPRHAEPVTIIGGEPTETVDVDRSLRPIAPSYLDWVFHWEGKSFCAEHWYAAQVLFRDPSELEPLPEFWQPRPRQLG
jgi:hypothetical protein